MIVRDLPLLDLFRRLQAAGLPLGVDDYEALLVALQRGFGLPDLAALERLCRTLWAKSRADAQVVRYHLEQVVTRTAVRPSGVQEEEDTPGMEAGVGMASPQQEPRELPGPPVEERAAVARAAAPAAEAIEVVQAVLHGVRSEEEIPMRRFLLAPDYLPITARQMKQGWRYLRRPVRSGPAEELDVEGTVRRMAREGALIEPVLVPLRRNRAGLFLLIDREGSMVPFHGLAHRLEETAARGGRLGRVGVAYFHNCPAGHVYHDPGLVEAETVEAFLLRVQAAQGGLLVFSDAGAARGRLRRDRVEDSSAFLQRCRQRCRHIAWLNPMPPLRWRSTSAAEIARRVAMFETSRRGLDRAIAILRGRHVTGVEAGA